MGPGQVVAQGAVRVAAEMVTVYTDNLFQSYSERADWIQQLSLDLDLGGPGLTGYYTAAANRFAEYDDLFTQTHILGLTARRPGAGRGLSTGDLSVTVREGRRGYEYKDYVEGRGYAGLKRYLRPTLMLRAGTGLRVRLYRHAGDFSYTEPTVYAQLSRFLPTRTTLVAGLDLGLKRYLRAAGETDAGDSLGYARTSSDDMQAQATAWIKVAQSLADRTGLQFQYTHLVLLGGGTRYRRPDEYDPSEELFDDGYSRSGFEVRTTLKHQTTAGIDLSATARRAHRRYEDRPALDLSGLIPSGLAAGAASPIGAAEDRQDTRTSLLARVDVDLTSLAPQGVADLGLRLEWSHLRVDSNDPYYDATTRVYSATARLAF